MQLKTFSYPKTEVPWTTSNKPDNYVAQGLQTRSWQPELGNASANYKNNSCPTVCPSLIRSEAKIEVQPTTRFWPAGWLLWPSDFPLNHSAIHLILPTIMADIRTFIGVSASQRVTSNVARVVTRLAASDASYRWVVPENLHVTLNSVGEVRDTELPELLTLIKRTVENFSRFDLSLHGVDGFPNANEPRVIWIGVDEGQDPLREIYGALADKLHHWGVNRERKPYVPHMTLGRLARGGRWNESLLEKMHRLRNHDGGFCQVQEIVVYSSFLDRNKPTYTPMSRIKLS